LSQYGPLIEDGIANLRQAINIDPQDATAMGFASALVSERADLRDARDHYSRDITEATAWTQRAIDVRREKSLRPQPAAVGTAAWFDAMVKVLPPPPTDVDGWKQYGVAWFANARYQPAADAFERAAMMNPRMSRPCCTWEPPTWRCTFPESHRPEHCVCEPRRSRVHKGSRTQWEQYDGARVAHVDELFACRRRRFR